MLMNVKAYEAQQFAYQHYLALLKTKPGIDSSPPKPQRVPFASRNLTHMTGYEEQLKTNKLVNKLIEIHDANYKPNHFMSGKSQKRKLSKKNRNLTFSDNKTYLSLNKSLVNPFKAKQKKFDIFETNCELIQKLSCANSDYKKAFSKEREKKLKNYSKILNKSKKEEEIRDNLFGLYEHLKIMKGSFSSKTRPTSSRGTSRTQKTYSESTRPQTAK